MPGGTSGDKVERPFQLNLFQNTNTLRFNFNSPLASGVLKLSFDPSAHAWPPSAWPPSDPSGALPSARWCLLQWPPATHRTAQSQPTTDDDSHSRPADVLLFLSVLQPCLQSTTLHIIEHAFISGVSRGYGVGSTQSQPVMACVGTDAAGKWIPIAARWLEADSCLPGSPPCSPPAGAPPLDSSDEESRPAQG